MASGFPSRTLNPALSIYLDLVRFGCAIVVLLYHAWPIIRPDASILWPGHDAVVVFFVLSGFVIAYTTDGRRKDVLGYALDRISRLWSVAIPAVLLAGVATPLVGTMLISDAAPPIVAPVAFAARALANVLFLGQIWDFGAISPLNAPFWSLNYEAWYYAAFGVWTYAGRRNRLLLVIVVAAMAGPKIVLLSPCWLLGVYLYRRPIVISELTAALLLVATGLAYTAYLQLDLPILIRDEIERVWPNVMGSLDSSRYFVSDWTLALIVGANFVAVSNMRRIAMILSSAERPIRGAASYTLSIYLYHMPLLALFWAGFGLRHWSVLLLIGGSIVLLGQLTEHQRWRVKAIIHQLTPSQFTGAVRRRMAA